MRLESELTNEALKDCQEDWQKFLVEVPFLNEPKPSLLAHMRLAFMEGWTSAHFRYEDDRQMPLPLVYR